MLRDQIFYDLYEPCSPNHIQPCPRSRPAQLTGFLYVEHRLLICEGEMYWLRGGSTEHYQSLSKPGKLEAAELQEEP
jgi:hypothetical protein